MPCQTVTVTAEDESELEITAVRVDELQPGTIEVETTIFNSIISGDGQTLTPRLKVTVGGSEEFNATLSRDVAANETYTHVVEIRNLQPANNIEVCAILV